MKTCFKCGVAKQPEDFYAHPMMKDGTLGKCRECTKRDSTDRRHAKLAEVREYDCNRATLPHRRALNVRISRKWRTGEIQRAHNAVARALRNGRLTRLSCSFCGSNSTHAHHDDYSTPLDVMWLCAVHHSGRHAFLRYFKLSTRSALQETA